MQDDAQGRSSKIQPLEPAFSSGKTSTEQLWVSNPPVIFGVTEFMTYKTSELHRMFAIPDMFSRFPQWKLWPIMARDRHRPHAPCSQNLARPWRLSSACHSQWWHPKVSQSFELSLNWEGTQISKKYHKPSCSAYSCWFQTIYGGFHKWGIPNRWLVYDEQSETPIKIYLNGWFRDTSISGNLHWQDKSTQSCPDCENWAPGLERAWALCWSLVKDSLTLVGTYGNIWKIYGNTWT